MIEKKYIFIILILILGIIAVIAILFFYPETIPTEIVDQVINKETIFENLPSEPLTDPPEIKSIFKIN